MVPHCSFDLHFSNSNTGLFFIGLLALCMSSLENVSLGLLPIFQLGCLGFFFVVVELFVYFGDEALVGCIVCSYFLPFCRLSFFFFNVVFCLVAVQKLLSLIRSHLFLFLFLLPWETDLKKHLLALSFNTESLVSCPTKIHSSSSHSPALGYSWESSLSQILLLAQILVASMTRCLALSSEGNWTLFPCTEMPPSHVRLS